MAETQPGLDLGMSNTCYLKYFMAFTKKVYSEIKFIKRLITSEINWNYSRHNLFCTTAGHYYDPDKSINCSENIE